MKNRNKRMRSRDRKREDFALFCSLSFPSFYTDLLLVLCVIPMTIVVVVMVAAATTALAVVVVMVLLAVLPHAYKH
jgi:hypothetical protein